MNVYRATMLAGLAGILMTSGGCGESPLLSAESASPALQGGGFMVGGGRSDDGATTQGGGFMVGGGRQDSTSTSTQSSGGGFMVGGGRSESGATTQGGGFMVGGG